jgi:hypothetical protein
MSISSITGGLNCTGPNCAADNAKAKADGFNMGGFSISDILTSEDKAITGHNPSAPINPAAMAVANTRFTGALQGNLTAGSFRNPTQTNNHSSSPIQQIMANIFNFNEIFSAQVRS